MSENQREQNRFLIPLATLYITIALSTIVLIYKVINLPGGYYASASTVIIPFWYALADLISEVYGYKVARNVIWANIFCECVFIFLITCFINLPSPPFWHHQTAYNTVLGNLPRILVGSLTAILLGSFINIYILTKWKILLNGRKFWLRSLGSSCVGEAIFTIAVFSIEFIGIYPLHRILELVVFSYLIKLIFQPIATTLVAILAMILKKVEKTNVNDTDDNLNPFQLAINQES